MELTKREKQICEEYSKADDEHIVHCHECPLNLYHIDPWRFGACECYATVSESKAKGVKRYHD